MRQLQIRPVHGSGAGIHFGFCVLVVLALIYLAWPLYRAFLPLQIDFNEGWNTYHTDVLSAGGGLYSFDDLTTANYPPLSFYVVRWLALLTGVDALYVGRTLSLAATLATTLAIWVCARRLGASRLAAAIGAFWWLASMSRFYTRYVGMDDPHLVALAMMAWALVLVLDGGNSRQAGLGRRAGLRAALAIVLMALAGFYKHDLFAIPAATLCWVTLRDWRLGLRLTVLGVTAVAAGFALCAAIFGEAFFHSLFLPRTVDLMRLGSIGRLQFVAPALLLAAIWAVYRRRETGAQLVLLLILFGLLSYLVQIPGDGVADNAAFELIFATAIGIACAFDDLAAIPGVGRWGVARAQILLLCVLIVRLLVSQRMAPYLLLLSPDFRAGLQNRVAVMTSETARIAAIPAPVVCDVMLVCRFAGKPFVVDPFLAAANLRSGRISQGDFSRRTANVRFEQVDSRTDVSDLQ